MGSRYASRIPNIIIIICPRRLHRAAAHLPRVDAIGGSSAGIIVDNEIRVASLLRAIPKKLFPKAARIFQTHPGANGMSPLPVMNDGDVTALAGALSLQQRDAWHRHGLQPGGGFHGYAWPDSRLAE